MLTLVHSNPARLEGDTFQVDRKFHTGMQEYAKNLPYPLLAIHPALAPSADSQIMDLVQLPVAELGYQVLTISVDDAGHPLPAEQHRLRAAVSASKLIYGQGFHIHRMARTLRVPMVALLEYNLRSTLTVAASQAAGLVGKGLQGTRAFRYYVTQMVPVMRQATLLHCNGYPIYEESRWWNGKRLLYFDSRMRREMVISEEALEARLAARRAGKGRKPRLLFSGRFEASKGALDVVLVGAACRRLGVDFEMHLHGQGSQRAAMHRAIAEHDLQGTVVVRDAVPYPELVEIAKGFDLFICSHIQDDPSCTYLETLGCGLPIAGYGNAMWRAMCEHASAGVVTPIGDAAALAGAVARLLADPARLDAFSRQARRFALEHTFDQEFARRTRSLAEVYQDPGLAAA
jgi:glycosyltransferase involved in cell wall biosynthesis